VSNWESETLEVWQRRKADFEECLEQELLMENPDDTLITVLRDNIDNCIREINVRN
tara:strand:- start:5293 stop:5460 length:168 start_codon:yes stop_codon:yes gene_type:complete